MDIEKILNSHQITELAKKRFEEERKINHLEGWFLAKEIIRNCEIKFSKEADCIRIAKTLVEVCEKIPLTISDYQIFAGTQNDAFARSYALINPTFSVDSFSGYCDPSSVFNDIDPIGDITKERINTLKKYNDETNFVKTLRHAYDISKDETKEAIYFFEQVTGHLIPDIRPVLKYGITGIKELIKKNKLKTVDKNKKQYYEAMDIALNAVLVLAKRYSYIAEQKALNSYGEYKDRFILMSNTLKKVPQYGADNLFEAIQSFILIWQVMCIEQLPNPYAFSVGNADRIFEPYRIMDKTELDITAALLKHFLVFFNVGDRSWAISQNIIVGGKSNDEKDLTNLTSYALLEAYFDMNLPQPILSIKLHKNTPDKLYQDIGKFLFSPGVLTPSFFNDDSLFEILKNENGIDTIDLQDYSVAGCQEPLIMGKDNGNTTNSWINLGKILELSINNGISTITERTYDISDKNIYYKDDLDILKNIRTIFYNNLEFYVDHMVKCANEASKAIAISQVPFLSTFMGGIETGIDTRDYKEQGTKYNSSGCLIHGLSVVADSFIAIDYLLKDRPQDAKRLRIALKTNFKEDPEIQQYMSLIPKYGNNISIVDSEAASIVSNVSKLITSKKNYLGNSFRADFSTPSTHLLYGYWVGATPDGRYAREQLGYGIDPLYGEAYHGLGFRIMSNMALPFEKMNGGYGSHLGINPNYFKCKTFEGKGIEFKHKILEPLFFNAEKIGISPYYLYVNVTTPEILKKVLDNPKKYAPSGVYIMRIHGTFVNFLDLSSDIQQDIIKRLDMVSTSI